MEAQHKWFTSPPPVLNPARGQPTCWVVYFGLSESWPHYDVQVEWDIPFQIDISHLPSLSIRGFW